jgi:hypothetical protein
MNKFLTLRTRVSQERSQALCGAIIVAGREQFPGIHDSDPLGIHNSDCLETKHSITSVTRTLRLSLFLLTASSLAFSQGLAPSTPSKDYIRFGGRVVAIESPAPVLDFSPAIVSLVVPVGTSASQVVTVTNGGTKTLAITAVALGGTNASYFSMVNSCGASLTPRASCTVSVTFSTATQGTYSANLAITDNAAGSPQTLTLNGSGFIPTPSAAVSPGSLTFAAQNVGSASASQTVAVTNGGTGPLTFGTVSISGTNAGDFSFSNGCGATLAVNASCQLSVRFAPSGMGTRTATLTIADNAGNVAGATQSVALSGTGLEPVITISPTSLNFGNQTVGLASGGSSVTVTNSGNAAAAITSVGTGSGQFSVTNGCPGSLAANASCQLTVTFTPAGSGNQSATLSVTDNSGNVAGSVQTVSLTGVGVMPSITVAPSPRTFGLVLAGQTSGYQNVVVTNDGPGLLSLSVAISGADAGDFVLGTNNCFAWVSPGATCTISFEFSPTQAGARTATAVLSGDQVGSPYNLTLSGQGKAGIQ